MTYTYADIPDHVHTKAFLPLLHGIWPGYQQLGWEYFKKVFDIFSKNLYTIAMGRLNDSIQTTKDVLEGKITHPEKVLAYAFFPPVISLRQDLQVGSTKLLYGESVDTSFILIDDNTQNTSFIVTAHIEDGLPVDWWTIGAEDEVLNRRHSKLGFKLKELPQKIKTFTNIGYRSIDVLRDIRYERTPQWSQSSYMAAIVWNSAAVNLILLQSNYESFGGLWDGLQSKIFGLPDYLFLYCPWPPLIKTITFLTRSGFILRLSGLATSHQLYTQGFSTNNFNFMLEHIPELVDLIYRKGWEDKGILRPAETITMEYLDLNENKDVPKKFTISSKKQSRIYCKDLELSWKEAALGVFLDITHERSESDPVDSSNIISTGVGTETKIWK